MIQMMNKVAQWSYDVMYQGTAVATVFSNGLVSIRGKLPYDLYLEEYSDDLDTRLMNVDNFRSWCASRVLPLSREHAKQILNACALSQSGSNRGRTRIALTYNCLSLRDSYWVRKNKDECWEKLNLHNSTSNECVDIALRGKNGSAKSPYSIAPDCSTDGVFPKAWVHRQDGLWLYKGDRQDSVTKEVEASIMLRHLGLSVLEYQQREWDCQRVSASACFTSKSRGYVSAESYSWNQDLAKAVERFRQDFLELVLATYLIGNADCHWGNWGFLFDYNQLTGMVPIFDLNHAFEATEDTLCLPLAAIGRSIRQLHSAREAAEQLGFTPREVSFDQFRYGRYVQERLEKL